MWLFKGALRFPQHWESAFCSPALPPPVPTHQMVAEADAAPSLRVEGAVMAVEAVVVEAVPVEEVDAAVSRRR
jgi:hypothetical protein